MGSKCQYYIEVETPRRRGTTLCIEHVTTLPRCMLKTPKSWRGRGAPSILRWILSGGSPTVLGVCNGNCVETNNE